MFVVRSLSAAILSIPISVSNMAKTKDCVLIGKEQRPTEISKRFPHILHILWSLAGVQHCLLICS